MSDKFVMYSDGERCALYRNGKLVAAGDHYYSYDYLLSYLEVDHRYSDDFLMGGRYREDIPRNLSDVERYSESLIDKNIQEILEEL